MSRLDPEPGLRVRRSFTDHLALSLIPSRKTRSNLNLANIPKNSLKDNQEQKESNQPKKQQDGRDQSNKGDQGNENGERKQKHQSDQTQQKDQKQQKHEKGQKYDQGSSKEELKEKQVQKTFVYMQLFNIINLPDTKYILEMKLHHPQYSIQPIKDHFTTEDAVILTDCDIDVDKPTFYVTLLQDNADTLNYFSDCPVMVSIYERRDEVEETTESDADEEKKSNQIKLHKTSSKLLQNQSEDDKYRLIALGTLDVLQFFSMQRPLSVVNNFLFPIRLAENVEQPTIQAIWQFHGVTPLLKDLKFCNIAFITFESIYNLKPELQKKNKDLVANLYFQSKVPNRRNRHDRVMLCTFTGFDKTIIAEQNINQKWESMKAFQEYSDNVLGLQTGLTVKAQDRFHNLLCAEGTAFYFDEINVHMDYALVCNSMHRYVLTEAITMLLEDVVAFNQQHIVIEIYRKRFPRKILYHGVFDLSIFLYPNVNMCRAAIELVPGSSPLPQPSTHEHSASGRMFAIVSICLLLPITETPINVSFYNLNYLQREKLKICNALMPHDELKTSTEICKAAYKDLDGFIVNLIDYIIKHNVHTIRDAKEYFCCNMHILISKVLQLICCDFNIRHPTQTSIEFHNVITLVYKELVQRIYDQLEQCSSESLGDCCLPDPLGEESAIKFVTMIKYAREAGNEEMAQFLLNQTKDNRFTRNLFVNFYKYIYDIERKDFESATKNKDTLFVPEIFIDLVEMYISYVENLADEDNTQDVLGKTLDILNAFVAVYPREVYGWMLLHCVYRRSSYLPGMTYTRWKFENLYWIPKKQLPPIPKSRWSIYNNYQPKPHSRKGLKFLEVINVFLNLGLYKFAELLYMNAENDFSDVARFMIANTFRVFHDANDFKHPLRSFPTENTEQLNDETRALRAQTDGNLLYFYGDIQNAMKEYAKIFKFTNLTVFQDYQLGLLRYAYYNFDEYQYQYALEPFETCSFSGDLTFLTDIGIAKSMYYLDHFEDALRYFTAATNHGIHAPDTWAFLALLHLKMGNNYEALECWKQAKLHPDTEISEEVLDELINKINPMDISLCVEKPLKL